MVIGIAGGSGFVGRHLSKLLIDNGYEVVIFTRSQSRKSSRAHLTYAYFDGKHKACDPEALMPVNAIINLAGANLAEKRWTEKRKEEIVNSRVKNTQYLLSQLKILAPQCKTVISASAVGFYGFDRPGKAPFTEDAKPADDFLGNTCKNWEKAALSAEDRFRTVILRLGVVLGDESGAFAEFEKPMSFGILPIIGSGKQVTSWIEVDDLAQMILFTLKNEKCRGIYNAVSPQPVSHKHLMKAIAKAKGGIKIPAPVPGFVLKIMLGEMAEQVLGSCTVSADKIQQAGFKFQYPDIESAVKAILAKEAEH